VDQVALASVSSTGRRRRRRSRASSESREEEQLRDLDALKQRPNDAASIERVPSRSRPHFAIFLRFEPCPRIADLSPSLVLPLVF
jgi:hypothetical protein